MLTAQPSTTRYAIIVAAGTGTRMGSNLPKQLMPLADGRPILVATIGVFAQVPDLTIILVLSAEVEPAWRLICQREQVAVHTVVEGGVTRGESVQNGLVHVPDSALVAIHDGVRPFVTAALVEACFGQAALSGAATAVVPAKDSLRVRLPHGGSQAVNREDYVLVQTPQTFSAALIKRAYRKADSAINYSDDASVAEAAGYPVSLVEGSYANIKITTREDLKL